MKKQLILIITLCAVGQLFSQSFSSYKNYTYSRTYLEPVTYNSSNPNANNSKKQIQSVQYTDGLGRPKQDIAIGSTYAGNDMVSTYFYDPTTGRQTKQYLPVTKASGSGAMQTVSEADINSYYGVSNAYAEVKTEDSPLSRPLETAAPGESWKMSGGKTKKIEYLFIGQDEVKKYNAVSDNDETVFQPTVTQTENYARGSLHKLRSTDEDGNVSVVYKNSLGQTLVTRQENGAEKLDTHYLYNQYGQLVMIIPPKASALGSLDQTAIDQLCYIYRYDAKGRLIEKKLPGKGKEEMVYNKRDQLILYQDARLKSGNSNNGIVNSWIFTKYDKYGRVLYSGLYQDSSPRSAIQNYADVLTGINAYEERTDAAGSFSQNGIGIEYTKTAYPTSFLTVLSVNYYDDYPTGAPAKPVLITETALSSDNLASRSTKTMPTASYVKNISDDRWTKTYYWYDQRGRSIGAQEINHLGGITTTHTEQSWAGITTKVETQHQRTANAAIVTVKERFVYNDRNYLEEHYHQVNSRPEELLAKYTYNELGQVTNKQVGNNLQSIDYDYNIRGWLTNINNTGAIGSKLFAYKINYDQRDGLETPNLDFPTHKVQPRYNGNITEVAWKAVDIIDEAPADTPQRQGFVYDQASRLLAGFYQMPDNPSIKANSEIIEEYDPNGNIIKLKRTGGLQKGRVKMMDNLNYTVEGNRITSVTDATNNQTGYEGGGGAITYDANGNMTAMDDKGISNISYNFLNLPEVITQTNVVSYNYRADGVKLKKKLVLNNAAGTNTINTEYLDGFVYTTVMIAPLQEALNSQDLATIATRHAGQEEIFTAPEEALLVQQPGNPQSVSLAYFPTAEGYYDYQNNQYIYQYKDHLGNVRLSYVRNPDTGSIEILDRNDYFPFGMNMYQQNSVYDASGTPLNNKYNQKELQETGFYDYGWRQYMPDLGRWFGMDQLSEKFHTASPYAYVMNNPAMLIDPDGRDAMFSSGTEEILNQYMVNTYWRQNSSLIPSYSGSALFGFSGINAPTQYSSVLKYWTSSLTVGQQNFDFDFYGERNGEIQGDYASMVLTQMTITDLNRWTADSKALESKAFDWYGFSGKANWTFGAIGTAVGNSGARFYLGTARPNTPVRFLGQNYYGNGRTFIKSSHVGGLIGKASFGVGLAMDTYGVIEWSKNKNSPNAVHPGKAGINTTMGAVGVWGGPPGAIISTVYFGVDSFYPGGWVGASETAAATEAHEQQMTGHPFFSNSAIKF